jgi:hypothetical protein
MWHVFSIYPLTYSIQFLTFSTIQYVNGLFKFLPTFQVNDSKISTNLDNFPSLLESMMQQLPIQLSQLTTCFYWNEKIDFALMDILKQIGIHHWSMLFHCSTFLVIQILLNKTKNRIQYLQFFLKNNTNGRVNEILSNHFISVLLIKVI